MARFAIICEYNPLHSGHAYHLARAREMGADSIVCIMSGNFTQRAEPAVAHKYIRARAAIQSGADLVIELPFPHAVGSAEFFAGAGVCAADASGADTLFFGSECNDIARLQQVAKAACSDAFWQEYQNLIKTNIGTAAAYAKAIENATGQALPSLSNDLLGIAYCKAILTGGYHLSPLCTKRQGSAYNDTSAESLYPSATALRKLLSDKGFYELEKYLPHSSFQALAQAFKKGEMLGNEKAYDLALLAILRTAPVEQLSTAALCGGGLGSRIREAAHNATNIATLYDLCAHKSLPASHVRRAVLYAALGISEQDLRCPPAYLNVLAANQCGRRMLADLRRTCPIPMVTKPADAPDCRQRELTDRADALYTLAMQSPQSSTFFKRQSPFMAD